MKHQYKSLENQIKSLKINKQSMEYQYRQEDQHDDKKKKRDLTTIIRKNNTILGNGRSVKAWLKRMN